MKVNLNSVINIVGGGMDELEQQISSLICESRSHVIAITGPSSVGKSAFAGGLAAKLNSIGTVEIICGDDFLRSELRGSSSYRSNRTSSASGPLTPADFDFGWLSDTLTRLRLGGTVPRWSYERGVGWTEQAISQPADTYIVEGLFLDSATASRNLAFDLVVVLEAPWELIADLRRRRDASVRSRLGINFRSAVETEHEIAQTRKAYSTYDRSTTIDNRVTITVDMQFRVTEIIVG